MYKLGGILFVPLLFLSIAFSQPSTFSRADTASARQISELRNQVRELQEELGSLKAVQRLSSPEQSDEVDRLEERLEKRLQELENKLDAMSRGTAPVVLNPRITAFINFAARSDSKTEYDLADRSKEISNRPFLRTVELELRNPVDPYAEAVTVISLENDAGKEFGIDAEEAYGLIKRLPILETAPLGLKLKIGKFRAPLGVDNKIHMHDLPWTTRPLVISEYLGTEHGSFFESGFNPTGIDMDFFLPNPISSTTLEMNVDVVRAGEVRLSQGLAGRQPAYIGHLNLSRDWDNEHLLIVGASTYQENGSPSARLYGADFTYKWAPAEQRESHSVVAGGEFFLAKESYLNTTGTEETQSPYGWFGYLQYQTSYWWYFGLRYDWVQSPTNDQRITRAVAAYASYYTTEFLRFRLGFEHRMSDDPLRDNLNTGIFEVNFVFGSHPTEPYWVNK